jgi:uncharacterized protein (DUF983 family)
MNSLFSNLCPRCRKGSIFKGFVTMNSACPACGEIFEKESGYFIGAMIASYFLGVFLALPLLLLGIFRYEMEAPFAITLSTVQVLLMQPFLFRFSRLLWIQLEARLTRAVGSD